jgi:peroxiredoxin Q/BCP
MIMRMPTAITGMFRGYIPLEISRRLLIMPLSLLVDEQGIIQSVYQGKDEGDHLPLDRVITFAK